MIEVKDCPGAPAKLCGSPLLLLAALLSSSCEQHGLDEVTARQTPKEGAARLKLNEAASTDFDQIIESIWNKNEKVRDTGMKALAKFKNDTKAPEEQIGLKALRAAARPYPFEKPEPGQVSADFVAVAASTPRPEYVPVVVELFDQFSAEARREAQTILAKLESRKAAEALMAIVRTHAPTGKLPTLIIWPLLDKPRHADVFFPEILKYASSPKLSHEIYQLCLAYCEAGLLSTEDLAPFTDQVVESYAALAVKLGPAQREGGIAWMWQDDYQESRHDAALLLDLFGYFRGDRVAGQLREALEYKDPRRKHFAVVSLLRLGKPVDKKHLGQIAGSAEMRRWLFIRLKELGKSSIYPEKFRTQAAFAEADMVNWLIYPTELDRAPDEIELMKIVSVDTGLKDGIYDYYLFRFRTKPPHWAAKDGWMAGVSGPYLRKDEPTTEALGETFSTFAKWDTKTPDEHVGNIRELTKKWREIHSRAN
jgi:hypothetical protein